MPKRAIVYIGALLCAGVGVLLQAAWEWRMQDAHLFFGLLTLAAMLSTMKITLPRMTGTMSPGFVAMLAGIALLSAGETVIIAGVSGVVQSLWRARVRPSLLQVAFNGAALSLSAWAAYHVAHWSGMGIAPAGSVSLLTIAASVDYLVNSLLVAAVLCLVERKPLLGISRNCNFWALPFYFAGVVVLGSVVSLGFTPAWRLVIPTLPLMWAVYDCYHHYVAAMARE